MFDSFDSEWFKTRLPIFRHAAREGVGSAFATRFSFAVLDVS
jgi:hypothetical protein